MLGLGSGRRNQIHTHFKPKSTVGNVHNQRFQCSSTFPTGTSKVQEINSWGYSRSYSLFFFLLRRKRQWKGPVSLLTDNYRTESRFPCLCCLPPFCFGFLETGMSSWLHSFCFWGWPWTCDPGIAGMCHQALLFHDAWVNPRPCAWQQVLYSWAASSASWLDS